MNYIPGRLFCIRFALLAAALLAAARLSAGDAPAAGAPGPWVWSGDAAGLHKLSLAELEDLYCRATVTTPPVGFLRGEVITFTNMRASKLAKTMADRHWVGKHIEPDGSFINQWKRVQALSSSITVGPSYADGKPSIIFEYPRMTPLFGPMRDEYREIAPGLYLGEMYRRVPECKFLGFNYLQVSPCGCCEPKTLVQDSGDAAVVAGNALTVAK